MTTVKRVDRQTLEDDRKSFKASPPQDFQDLHQSARGRMLSKRRIIEDHWGCYIQDCIPQSCAPRVLSVFGRHAKAGDDNALLPWYRWPPSLMNELARLAELTKLPRALELVQVERSKRHSDSSNQYREAVQTLPGDIKPVIRALEEEAKSRSANRAAGIWNVAPASANNDENPEAHNAPEGRFVLTKGMLRYMGAGSSQSRSLIWSTLDEESTRRITAMRRASVKRTTGLEVQAGQLKFEAAKSGGEAAADMRDQAAALDARREKLLALHQAQFGD